MEQQEPRAIMMEVKVKIFLLMILLGFGIYVVFSLLSTPMSSAPKSDPTNQTTISPDEKHRLLQGETLLLTSEVSVRLDEASPTPQGCADCFEEARLTAIVEGKELPLNFQSGGFAGVKTGWLSAGPVEISVVQILSDSVYFEYRLVTDSTKGR